MSLADLWTLAVFPFFALACLVIAAVLSRDRPLGAA